MKTCGLGLVLAILFLAQPVLPQTAVNLTAKTANVGEPGVAVKINIMRWSTDEERKPIVAALDPAAQAQAAAAAASGRGARAARGLDPDDPALADVVGAGARAGRGGGRGNRGGGRGDAAPTPPDPIATLTAALGKAPTVGFIWTNEVVGYSIKYALRTALPEGGERIILATDRRFQAGTVTAKTSNVPRTDYEFTFIELRLDPKGSGEGKSSLTTKVILDKQTNTIALENYAASPATLQNVKR